MTTQHETLGEEAVSRSCKSGQVSAKSYDNPNYRNYVLVLLTVVYAFNFIDRQLLVILQESIKQDLLLSDTQLGLLTGFAFAVFYVAAGIPIARWADQSNRRNIIALSVGIWSFMTAISGMAINYTQLLLARIGVGIGEAGGTPPAHSMISDMYPPEHRATAMSFYSIGINVGILFGFFLGGLLNEVIGWRMTLVILGVPGILLAVFIKFKVAEPARGRFESKADSGEPIPFMLAIKQLLGKKSIRYLFVGCCFSALAAYAAISWSAPFFIRVHDMGTGELGLWLAVSSGVFGAFGTFMTGYWCDKLGLNDKRWYIWLPAIAIFIAFPCHILILTTSNTFMALLANLFVGALMTCFIGPTVAILHGMVDPRMRAMSSAIFYLFLNIIGLGIGPSLIGVVSDALASNYGDESLRYAMLIVIPVACICSAFFLCVAAKYIREENVGGIKYRCAAK